MNRTCLAVLGPMLVLAGCGVSQASMEANPSASALPSTAELVGLFETVRVPGLEDRRFNHAEFWGAVTPYLGGSVSSELAGKSAEGREIWLLTYGRGPASVLLWSQMHGDESTATMALADIARFFHESPHHPLAQRIAERATIHMIPMLNPDGAERFQRRNAQGIDINRDARRLQTPEGRILKAVRDELEPDFGFNLHDQRVGVRVGQGSSPVAIALLAPAFNEARDVDAKRARAMRVASVLVESMAPLVGGHIAKYDDTFNPRAFGDLMGLWGASTVLIESGGWPDDPQKQHLRKTNFVGILAALDAIATGSYAQYDPAVYESLQFNGRRMAHLLVYGGTLAVPDLPTLRADLLIDYERPLLGEGARISDVGDLGEVQALDTLDVTGRFLIPSGDLLDRFGGINIGGAASFVIADDSLGRRVRMRFEGRRP